MTCCFICCAPIEAGVWLWRPASNSPPAQPESYPTLESLRAGFEQEQSAWRALLEEYSAAEIEGEISLTNWRGEILTMPLWRVLQHLILHGMQHHAELAQLLSAKGQSPGNIDFIFFA